MDDSRRQASAIVVVVILMAVKECMRLYVLLDNMNYRAPGL